MSEPRTVADVLERAADLIEPEGKWTQGAYARDAAGKPSITGRGEGLVCFCAVGAIDHSTQPQNTAWSKAIEALQGVLSKGVISTWNDAAERTQAEVVAALREAAALAREQGQ